MVSIKTIKGILPPELLKVANLAALVILHEKNVRPNICTRVSEGYSSKDVRQHVILNHERDIMFW